MLEQSRSQEDIQGTLQSVEDLMPDQASPRIPMPSQISRAENHYGYPPDHQPSDQQ